MVKVGRFISFEVKIVFMELKEISRIIIVGIRVHEFSRFCLSLMVLLFI